jgi:hypothetical protein
MLPRNRTQGRTNVSFWHKADVAPAARDDRLWSQSGPWHVTSPPFHKGGGPKGERNGAYQTGRYSAEARAERQEQRALMRELRRLMAMT